MKAIRYTILTEDKPNLAELAVKYFKGFTIRKGLGYYEKEPEPSAEIVIIGSADDEIEVLDLTSKIRSVNQQVEVWYTREEIELIRVVAT